MSGTNEFKPGCITLQALRNPDICRDDVLSKFTDLVSKTLGVPSSFISVLDDDFQYIKAAHNFNVGETLRADSLCQYVVEGDQPLVVPDTQLDACFAVNPFVVGEPFVRFYAGVPLKSREGLVLGTLCVVDGKPQSFSAEKLATMTLLSQLVISFLKPGIPLGLPIWLRDCLTDSN